MASLQSFAWHLVYERTYTHNEVASETRPLLGEQKSAGCRIHHEPYNQQTCLTDQSP